MTRKSERELERAVEDLREAAGVADGPLEIEITDTIVASDWSPDGVDEEEAPDADPGEVIERRRTRIYRDETGEWCSERVDLERADAPEE